MPRVAKKCAVCSFSTFHSFYGATVCDPCRTFFRRQVVCPKVCIQAATVSLTNTGITVYEMQRKQQLFSQAMGETGMQLVSLPKVS